MPNSPLRSLGLPLWFGLGVTFAAACGGDDPAPPAGAQPGDDAGASSSSSSSSSGGGGGDGGGGGSAGCGVPVPQKGPLTGLSIAVGSATRTYALDIPSTYDQKRAFPVIFAFHGDGGTGASAKSAFKFDATHEADAIFVYPDGRNKTWDLDTWDAARNPDIQLVDAIVAELKKSYCVQGDRFFAAGFSRGGFFANHLGCHRGGVFRGIASHGGGGPYDSTNANYDSQGRLVCPGQPIGALIVIGSQDGLLGDSRESRTFWRFKNGCQNATQASSPSPCVAHDGCSKPLTWCEIGGLGHRVWASGAEATWDFFAKL